MPRSDVTTHLLGVLSEPKSKDAPPPETSLNPFNSSGSREGKTAAVVVIST